MSDGRARIGVGTRFIYDGELMQVIEMHAAAIGTVAVLRSASGGDILRELLSGDRARVVPDDSGP